MRNWESIQFVFLPHSEFPIPHSGNRWLGPGTPSLREGNQPVAIALLRSRRDHFPEKPARVGQSCRKLSVSGSCGCSFPIRYEVKARASLRP